MPLCCARLLLRSIKSPPTPKSTQGCLQSGTLAFALQANERYRCCGPRLRCSALRQEGHLASASSLARRRSPPISSRPPRADYQLHCYILVLSGCLAGATVVLSTAKRLTRACGSPNCAGSVIPLTSRMWSRGCGSVPSAHLSAQLSFESAIRSHEAKWDRAPKKRLVREDRTDEFPGRRALFIFSSLPDRARSSTCHACMACRTTGFGLVRRGISLRNS